MDNDKPVYDAKIKRILEKFLQVNFKVKNDVYLNSLILYLSSHEDKTHKNSLFVDWLIHATNLWQSQQPPSAQILAFAINLCSISSKDETTFKLLNSHQIYEKCIALANPQHASTSPIVKLSIIKLFDAIVQHQTGLEWLVHTKNWLIVVGLSLTNQTIYITRDGNKFLATLLEFSCTWNEAFCSDVVRVIMERLSESNFNSIKTNMHNVLEISDDEIYSNLRPTLSMVSSILESFLQKIGQTKNLQIIRLFMDVYKLEQCTKNYLLVAQNREFAFDLYKIQMILIHYELVLKVEMNETSNKCYQLFFTNITRRFPENVLKLAYTGFVYWQYTKNWTPPCTVEVMNDCTEPLYENQLMILQFMPLLVISTTLHSMKHLEGDYFRDNYIDKIVKLCAVPTLRLAYTWKDGLTALPNMFEIATLALQYILKSKHLYDRDVGVTIFQSLIYCLKDITDYLMENPNPNKAETLMLESAYISLLIDTIGVFIEEFQVVWRDSIETIGVMKVAFDVLSIPTWPPKLVVKALKLVDISISKYMSPSMILLIDKMSDDSSLPYVGPLLYAKLHDVSWEVRDSALEVLCTIANNAKTKFPSFQKIVLDTQLPSLVVKIVLKDEEFFVRTTALKCLQEMCQVEDFWTNITAKHELNELVMDILHKETEGVVRKEAATLLGTIYENHPSMQMPKVYDVMTHAAIADLHWEVKVNALNFWEIVINDLLQQQGMIDGSFPSFLFSKEERKIISLTECEVRKRLHKVLHKLSQIGCLHVLVKCIQDDCDLEVAKRASAITRKFLDLLAKYKIGCECGAVGSPPTSPCINDDGTPKVAKAMVCETAKSADEMNAVLHEIVQATDENLLSKMCCSVESGGQSHIPLQGRRVLGPEEFLKFSEQDFECIVKYKEKWLEDIDQLGSLLDDILKEYDENDINSMDCY